MSWGLQRWGRYQIVKDYGGICRKDLSVREECSTLKVHEHFTYAVIHTFLTESSKSPASIAKSNKQWVGTCLYQEECKLLLINCGAVIRL